MSKWCDTCYKNELSDEWKSCDSECPVFGKSPKEIAKIVLKHEGETKMTAKELNTMVNAMRTKYHKVDRRTDITDEIFYLQKGLCAIGRNDLAEKLAKLYTEIDSVDTDEIVKLGTFR